MNFVVFVGKFVTHAPMNVIIIQAWNIAKNVGMLVEDALKNAVTSPSCR